MKYINNIKGMKKTKIIITLIVDPKEEQIKELQIQIRPFRIQIEKFNKELKFLNKKKKLQLINKANLVLAKKKFQKK